MRSPSFVLIGCGSIGSRHLHNLVEAGAHVPVIVDPDEERGRSVAMQYSTTWTPTLREALKTPGLDGALVCSPPSNHLETALEAASAGLHLFIEKPVAHTTEGLPELAEIVRKKKLKVLVACNMRWHPSIVALKQAVDNKRIGRVLIAQFSFGQYLPDWRPGTDYRLGYSARAELGGGVLLDAIHEIDLVRWILGPVRHVNCLTRKLSDLEISTEDFASLTLELAESVVAEVHLDYVERGYRREARLIGSEGTAEWRHPDGFRISTADQGWTGWVKSSGWDVNDMYREEIHHWIRCVAGEEPPQQNLQQAKDALEVVMAARESSRTGKLVRLHG